MGNFYATTFCNKAHRLSDGAPIKHECYMLDTAKLRQEARGAEVKGSMIKLPARIHSGVK